jgi:hypothetical protein
MVASDGGAGRTASRTRSGSAVVSGRNDAAPGLTAAGGLLVSLLAVGAFAGGVSAFVVNSQQGPGTVDVAGLALNGHAGIPTGPDPVLQRFVALELGWDLVLIEGYGVAAVLGALLLRYLARSAAARRWSRFGLVAAVTAVVADLLENLFLWLGVGGTGRLLGWAHPYDLASIFAVVKFSAFVPAVLILVVGVLLTWSRALPHLVSPRLADHRSVVLSAEQQDMHGARPVLPDDPWNPGRDQAVEPPTSPPLDGSTARWRRAYDVPVCADSRPPTGNPPGQVTGIGLSGGGIRAASVAMGALQSREWRHSVIPAAQHLISVSGGGYTSGAFQQALTDAGQEYVPPSEDNLLVRYATAEPPSPAQSFPATAFLPGTVEEDHLRRHSSYLAANPTELLLALGLLARHLLLTLTLLFGPAILLGVAAGRFYESVRLTAIPPSVVAATTDDAVRPAFPVPRAGALWALGLLIALAVALWLLSQYASAYSSTPLRRRAHTASVMVAGLAGVVGVLTVVLPALIWAASWALHQTGGVLAVGGPIGGLLLTYGASVAALGWRNRKRFTGGGGTDPGSGGKKAKAVPRGILQLLLVAAALLVLAAGWLLVLGGMAIVGLQDLPPATLIALGLLFAVVVFLGVFSDETTLSLHPFYRARLASAFAVRRVRRRADGQTVARPYAPEERTSLHTYGKLPPETPFPHVVFAASATLGEKRTAPGAHRISYTFCGHWIGGPDVGYVSAKSLYALAPARIQRDLTVQGAVALSGAAIAASIGGQRTAWYETLFVVTGLRLGAWMPNPSYLIATHSAVRPWTEPGLPRNRRLSYLLRQLFGVHSASAPLIQVSDGGFYDNLGLVELFRRGCTRIYCIDASGDNPPAATTLSQALTLAYHELGVQTVLDGGTWSTFTAGSADPLTPKDPLSALSARLSKSGIITGTFEYPPGTPHAGRGPGVLVVAKSALWPGLPYQVLAHAQDAGVFPRDSTGDQFFDDRQYAAYTELGRALGAAAAEAMAAREQDLRGPVPAARARSGATRADANGADQPAVPPARDDADRAVEEPAHQER